jgi:hypothetical protein
VSALQKILSLYLFYTTYQSNLSLSLAKSLAPAKAAALRQLICCDGHKAEKEALSSKNAMRNTPMIRMQCESSTNTSQWLIRTNRNYVGDDSDSSLPGRGGEENIKILTTAIS